MGSNRTSKRDGPSMKMVDDDESQIVGDSDNKNENLSFEPGQQSPLNPGLTVKVESHIEPRTSSRLKDKRDKGVRYTPYKHLVGQQCAKGKESNRTTTVKSEPIDDPKTERAHLKRKETVLPNPSDNSLRKRSKRSATPSTSGSSKVETNPWLLDQGVVVAIHYSDAYQPAMHGLSKPVLDPHEMTIKQDVKSAQPGEITQPDTKKVKQEPMDSDDINLMKAVTSDQETSAMPATGQSSSPKEKVKKEEDRKDIKFKVKAENPVIDKDGFTRRLEAANISETPFEIKCERDILEFTVSRDFMSDTYGGSRMKTFPQIALKRLNEHGYQDFMFPGGEFQPRIPEVPGAPGLWLHNGGSDIPEYPAFRLFTTIQKAPVIWKYQGQYELQASSPLTTEEWSRQKHSVRTSWTHIMHTKTMHGRLPRARIYGRKVFGRAPTQEEIDEIVETEKWKTITQEEITEAFNRGDEQLQVFTMRCVGYDVQFQTDLIKRHEAWKKMKASKRKAEEDSKGKVEKKAKRAKKSKKKAKEEDSGEQDEDGGEGPKVAKKARRGAKSKKKAAVDSGEEDEDEAGEGPKGKIEKNVKRVARSKKKVAVDSDEEDEDD